MLSLAKRVLLVALFAVLAFATLGTVTYAWLSVSTTNNVDTLDLGAEADSHLELSLDGINFSSTLKSEEVMKYIMGVELKDITTSDGKEFTFLNGSSVVKNKHYISLDVWARSTHKSSNVIFLVDNNTEATSENLGDGTAVSSKGITWRPDNTFLYDVDTYLTPNDLVKVYSKDSVRIGFVESNVNGFYSTVDNRDDSDLSIRIIDPSENPHRGYGKEYGAVDYYNRRYPNTPLEIPNDVPLTQTEFTKFYSSNENLAMDSNTQVATLQTSSVRYGDDLNEYYKVAKFTLNFWIEGWDADTFDPIMRDSLKIQLKFKLGRY